MLASKKDQNPGFNLEKLLTNRRGKITASNVLKLLLVFIVAVFIQCLTLLLTKDFILLNHISCTNFLFAAFTVTAIISSVQQKTWRYFSYLNPKRIPIIAFQGILYSFSFLCLIYGITVNGVLQYYALFNAMHIMNAFSNLDQIFSLRANNKSKPRVPCMTRVQLFCSVVCFIVGMLSFAPQNTTQMFALCALLLYHIVSYLREQHYTASHRQYRSLQRIQPLSVLCAALIMLSLSVFSHVSVSTLSLPHHNHAFDLQEQFANDERAFMRHSANHDIDTSAKLTHRRRLLRQKQPKHGEYAAQMKELERLAALEQEEDADFDADADDDDVVVAENEKIGIAVDDKDEADLNVSAPAVQVGWLAYLSWSFLVYALFALCFVLLDPHLSYLQRRLYELVFANHKLKHIVHSRADTLSSAADASKPLADILKLTSTRNSKLDTTASASVDGGSVPSGGSNGSTVVQLAPKWSRLLFLYQFVSIQCVGILASCTLSLFVAAWNITSLSVFAAVCVLIGNECYVRSMLTLQLSYHPPWFNRVLYFLFGGLVVATPTTRSSQRTGGSSSRSSLVMDTLAHIPSFVQHLRDVQTSRRILIFLTINFLFMFVEFVYGYMSNSLGLISDACHMLFDCIALVVGLLASYLGSKHASNASLLSTEDVWLNQHTYSYGYGKIKVMSGFINAIFLVYVGISVLVEAIERIIHPPHIHTDQLLVVAVLGLVVNLVGLFFFHDAHMMSHDGCSSHDHGHHGHDHHGHHHEHDHNIRGIFLHILADTLGSVGVIVSSLLIYFFEWTITDALCSVFIAVLIFVSVYPLIQSTSKILLQQTPTFVLNSLRNDLSTVLSTVDGLTGYREPHFWENEPGNLIGTMHVQIDENADEQQVLTQISRIVQQRFGIKHEKNLCVQIEKQFYLDKCDPIHHSVYSNIVPIQKRKHMHSARHAHQQSVTAKQTPSHHQHHSHEADHHGHHHGHDHHHGHAHEHHDHAHEHDHEQNHGHNHHHPEENNNLQSSDNSFIKVGH